MLKLSIGPTAPIPGPTLLNVEKAAPKVVSKLILSKDKTKIDNTNIKT